VHELYSASLRSDVQVMRHVWWAAARPCRSPVLCPPQSLRHATTKQISSLPVHFPLHNTLHITSPSSSTPHIPAITTKPTSKTINMHRTYSMRASRAPTASQIQNPPPPSSSTKSGRFFGKANIGTSCDHTFVLGTLSILCSAFLRGYLEDDSMDKLSCWS